MTALKKRENLVGEIGVNINAQEMEREEGEGVKGRVWSKGEEEGGQGHEEQDDGQGIEVPELQVLVKNWSKTHLAKIRVWQHYGQSLEVELFQGQPGR